MDYFIVVTVPADCLAPLPIYVRLWIKSLLVYTMLSIFITVTSQWAQRRLKSPASRWFAQTFV